MYPLPVFEAEPLLLGAVALTALGMLTVLVVVARSVGLARAGEPLERGLADLRCRAILDALPDPVVVRDGAGRIVSANAKFARLASGPGGEPRVTATGRVGERPDGARLIDEAIATPEGSRWYAWAETPIEIGGRSLVLRSGREITERMEAERALVEARARAEAASEAKTRFLASVSHEFRTPLNGILGMTGLLADTPLDAEQGAYLQAVRSSAEAFLALVDEILDFAKIEAGRIDLAASPFDLAALVQGVVELLAPRAQGKGTSIACMVASDVPRMVTGDADRLRQVLFNLAGNAVKFTATGGVGIAVERGTGPNVVIRVEDTGPGIPADRAAQVFEEFEQGGDGRPQTAEPGTGLGLAITRRLVECMNGTVELDSLPGSGSRFVVTLDLPAAPDPAGAVDAGAVRPAAHPAPALRVLVLSDAPFEGPYLVRTIVEAGHDAVLATTLPDALGAMDGARFDAVIADHGLAEADVRIVAREARRCGIGRSIVLLSPFERRDLGSPHAAGFDAYLIKPVRARSLFEQVNGDVRRPADLRSALSRIPDGARGRRVLLAEDNEINALVAMRCLEKLGAVVEWAHDGPDALALAEAALAPGGLGFDLVLMDVRMPGMNGCEVTRRLRDHEARFGLSRCRIVALTASVVGEIDGLVRPDGFDAVLRKPFSLDALAAELAGGPVRQAAAS